VSTEMPANVVEGVRNMLARVLAVDLRELGPNPAVYRTPGWDSIATIEVVAALEEQYGISVPDEVIDEQLDLKRLATCIWSAIGDRE
jgi:acyl carrier protein